MNSATEAAVLAQVILLSSTFSHRGEPLSLPQNTPHENLVMNVNMRMTDLNAGAAVAVVVTVTTSPEDEKALYDFKVEMMAIIQKTDATTAAQIPPENLLETGVLILYPFVRECIANITARGRFGPVWINPFNVRAAIQAAAQTPAS